MYVRTGATFPEYNFLELRKVKFKLEEFNVPSMSVLKRSSFIMRQIFIPETQTRRTTNVNRTRVSRFLLQWHTNDLARLNKGVQKPVALRGDWCPPSLSRNVSTNPDTTTLPIQFLSVSETGKCTCEAAKLSSEFWRIGSVQW